MIDEHNIDPNALNNTISITEQIDRETREYLATIPVGDRWLDQNPEAKSLVELGLQQAATEKSIYLGSFAEYAALEIDD